MSAERVFVGPPLCPEIGRIKSSIDPRLDEEINVRPKLCVEKETQPLGEKIVSIGADQTRRRLRKMIIFQIEQAADPGPDLVVKYADR